VITGIGVVITGIGVVEVMIGVGVRVVGGGVVGEEVVGLVVVVVTVTSAHV